MPEAGFDHPALREFAGCEVMPMAAPRFFEWLLDGLRARDRPLLVGHHNLHSLYLYHRCPSVADFYRQCDACYVDGVGVLWLLRAAGLDTRLARRFSLMDCLPQLFDLAQHRKLRVFYLGGSELAVERARAWIDDAWPDLPIQLHHGYLRGGEAVETRINAFGPDVLLVGMGMPAQERWILAHRASLEVGAILQAGGTLDYYTGLQARPPARLSRVGLAWLYRLLSDPRRLWRRYLVTPWSLLGPTLRLRRSLRARRRQ